MHRLVAVKMLPAGMMKNPDDVARFEREVTAVARLSHPNIVTAFDADKVNGVHLLVMEYVEGSDLWSVVMKNGPLPVQRAVNYVLQAANGLEAAHAEGIVHRDIKPANLLLDRKGKVKILDMGLVRIADASHRAELTNTGTVMGTVDYMAPEQALNSKAADVPADIYSLGCSLYYLLAGKAIYDGDTVVAKLLAHRDQPIPSIRAVRPDVPEQLELVFRKMVAKQVQDRYHTMSEVIADLRQMTSRHEQSRAIQPSSGSLTNAGLSHFLNDISRSRLWPTRRPHAELDKGWIHAHKKSLLICGVVMGAFVLSTGVVTPRATDGKLIVTVNEPGADVQVLNDQGQVEVARRKVNESVSIAVDPGKHRLQVGKEGFRSFSKDFEIELGDKRSFRAVLVPMVKPVEELLNLEIFELFNGHDLTGWIVMGDRTNWDIEAEKGVLTATGKGGQGWLFIDRDVEDFVLDLEYRAEPGANSGIAILASPEDAEHFEVQVSDIANFPTGGVWSQATNRVNRGFTLPTQSCQLNAPGEWNSLKLELRARKLGIFVNGVEVLRLGLDKLAQRPHAFPPLKRTKGRIGLECQTNVVRYRNIRLSEITDSGGT
jgi:serine/threonine protein kinase